MATKGRTKDERLMSRFCIRYGYSTQRVDNTPKMVSGEAPLFDRFFVNLQEGAILAAYLIGALATFAIVMTILGWIYG